MLLDLVYNFIMLSTATFLLHLPLHELGHGIMCWIYGIRVRPGCNGVVFYLDVIDDDKAEQLSDGKKIAVYMAGPMLNILLGIWFAFISTELAILSFLLAAVNLFPYKIKGSSGTDGYKALELTIKHAKRVLSAN